MQLRTRLVTWTVALTAIGVAVAGADYETHPELRPEYRCGGGTPPPGFPPVPAIPSGRFKWAGGQPVQAQPGETEGTEPMIQCRDGNNAILPTCCIPGDPTGAVYGQFECGHAGDPGGTKSLHCQRLFWDLPAASHVGQVAIAAPFDEDRVPRFPNGITDRPPPLYYDDVLGEGFEEQNAEGTRRALCPLDANGDGDRFNDDPAVRDPDVVPWWAPVLAEGSSEPQIGEDPTRSAVGRPGTPQSGPLYRVECRRGSRSTFGPWQVGTNPKSFDALAYGNILFESTERMDRDAAAGRLIDDGDNVRDEGETGRREWNVATEFYNHFGSHHGTCWNPETGLTSGALTPQYRCNDPDNPWAASDTGPGGECEDYHRSAEPGGKCYAGDADPRCPSPNPAEGQMFRNATQYPGRLYVEIPDHRGVVSLEDQIWDCDHHVVHQLPPGSYGMTRVADYRKQKGGLKNPTSDVIYDTPPGAVFGGTVGEMLIQYFTEPWLDPATGTERVKSIDVSFEVIQDLATTWYPPFTWHAHQIVWHAPFDLAIGLMTIHSHHRSVKGFIDILPANPVRHGSSDEFCGGSKPEPGENAVDALLQAQHVYTNLDWEDARICEYWRQPDGPIILRKGQAIKTTCYVNNGVTPEAIKHGLVAGAAVEGMRNSGIPIPPDPKTLPTGAWSSLLVESPLGVEFLYGTHPPVNYRVVYKCGPEPGVSLPTGPICRPNPSVDADGDYIDGPYRPGDGTCPAASPWCNPATIMFANVGEDEMCIPVFMYWPLDRLVRADGSLDEEATQKLLEGKTDQVGLPGSIPKQPGDIGDCRDCSTIPRL